MKGIFDPLTGYHNRRSIRLKGYDYSNPGAYFLTLNIHPESHLVLGNIVWATGASPETGTPTNFLRMELNEFGRIVREEWKRSFEIRRELKMDEFQIMPDHFHAIVIIRDQKQYVHGKEAGDGNILGEPVEGDTPVARTDFVQKKCTESNPCLFETVEASVAQTSIVQKNIAEINSISAEMDNMLFAPIRPRGAKPRSIGALIAGFKAATIQRINEARNAPGKRVWQRDYYDRIVRDNRALYFIRRYIRNNPANWILDHNKSVHHNQPVR
jgi:putative transposase